MERLAGLYGYRPIQTPVFEDTELFLRTSGQGSDVVQKEMYTFADRCDRSLTLRPEGTAPIARAYVEHGLHREPQPHEALHDRPDVPVRRPRPRPLSASTGSSPSRRSASADPGDRRRDHPALRRPCSRRLGIATLPARAELDRRPRLPARLRRAADRVARRARRRAGRGGKAEACERARCASSTSRTARTRALLRTHRRSATRSAPTARRTSPPCAAVPRRLPASPTSIVPTLVRGLDYYSRTTLEFMARRSVNRRRPSPAAAATTTSSRRSAGRRRPGIGFGAGIERLMMRSRTRASAPSRAGRRCLLRASRPAPRGSGSCAAMAALRRAGLACRHRLRWPIAEGPAHAGRPRAERRTTVIVRREDDAPDPPRRRDR